MKPKKTKTVKAWALILKSLDDDTPEIYLKKSNAENKFRSIKHYYKKCYAIIPCTISYQIPKKPSKK